MDSIGLLDNTLISVISAIFFSSKLTHKNFATVCNSLSRGDVIYILGNDSSLNEFLNFGNNLFQNVMVVNYFASSPLFKETKTSSLYYPLK